MSESPTQRMRATRARYRPTDELGHGATATVWRARDSRTGRDVALKRFHRHLLDDPAARQRIGAEAAAAARINHPSIVSAIDLVDDRDGLALVFPYVEGTTLAAQLADGSRVEPRAAARIALDIADGLAVAHAGGVVHRDVKPANILLGADGRARLLDFGISRAVGEGEAAHDLTGAGMAIGTLPYMAPEQLAAGPTTPASDVYGLGVVLYEMLGGRRPFAAASPVTLAAEQQQQPARIADVPRPLMQLALDAVAVDAARRPGAAQLARGLRAWLDGRVDPQAVTVTVAAVRPRHRRLAGWAALGLALIVLVTAVPLLAAAWVAAPSQPPELARGDVALASPTTAPTQAPTVAPAQAPVVGASKPQSPSAPVGGRNPHKHHHHRKHHHGD
jgi:serine/threonine-protein kinase